jgi:hypothetical protein
MARWLLLLRNEFRLVRSTLLIHALVVAQPTLFFLLMAGVMVHPTFDMAVERPSSALGETLVAAMAEVGSPIGDRYIRPIVIDAGAEPGYRQVVRVEQRPDGPVAIQEFDLIDSNLVKNYRNRLTAAGLRLWNQALDGRAITLREHPWLPRDVPFIAYYGLALLPLAAFIAGTFIGGVQTAQDFELRMILEYRLASLSATPVVLARLARIAAWALLSCGLLLLAVGLVSGIWPAAPALAALALLPVAIMAGCLGILAGLLVQRTIPTFVIALTTSLGSWLLGGAFGLPAGFGGLYEQLSRWSPVTYAVDLLFLQYYGIVTARPADDWLILGAGAVAMTLLTIAVYRRRVQGEVA